ncbi:MAG TPA: hypothetical protein VD905_18890, partial [Flavobacteriales bacterium]|nr:hypothetical protein [Flavobacteriales bacterium]
MRKILFVFALVFSAGGVVEAQVLDQANTTTVNSGWTVDNVNYTNLAQSFTADMNGPLNKIVVSVDPATVDGTFSLVIRDGNGYTGTVLATEYFTLTTTTPFGEFSIPITTSVNIVSGNQYTFIIDEFSGTGSAAFHGTNDTYTGGILYQTIFGSTELSFPSYDMWFKTFISGPDTYSTIDISSCMSYTSPSGNYTWTADGTYNDTIPNAGGGDSIMTINLTVINLTDQTAGAIDASLCYGDSTTIELGSTEAGV